MKSNVAGIETARYDVVEVLHSVEALTELFKGASVVLNMVGPFARFGPEVVEACLAAKCHYTDTTGEQDWLITLDEKYSVRFAAARLLLSPGMAQMYTTGEIAAQLCLETPGIDTLDIAVFWGGSPTIASTQTILVNAAMAKAYYLEQNQYVEHQADAGLYSLTIPGQHEAALALPWGGTSHPVWFKKDPRVANVKVMGGVFNKPLMLAVPQIVAAALKATEGMNDDDRYAALAKTASGVMNSMPPRENPRINKWSTRFTRRARWRVRTASLTAIATPSRPACCRPSPPRRCCNRRPGASASRRVARLSATTSCSVRCAASASCSNPCSLSTAESERHAPDRLPRQGRAARLADAVPDDG